MLYYLLGSVYVLVCLLLLLVVLLQQGKGGDIASAFGGGGSTQAAFGARSAGTVLTRASAILGALFMIGALALAILGQRGAASVVSGVSVPAQTPPAQTQPAPAQQAPAQDKF